MKYKKIQSKAALEESAQPVVKPGASISDFLAGLEIDMNVKLEMSFVQNFRTETVKVFLVIPKYVIDEGERNGICGYNFLFICAKMTIYFDNF